MQPPQSWNPGQRIVVVVAARAAVSLWLLQTDHDDDSHGQ